MDEPPRRLRNDTQGGARGPSSQFTTDSAAPSLAADGGDPEMGRDAAEAGRAVLRAAIAAAPSGPGTYRMIGRDDRVLYVGKAKSIVKRLPAYLRHDALAPRLRQMVALTARVEFAPARSEAEALMLEADLIRVLRPHFNILLREGRTPCRLALSAHPFPRLLVERGPGGVDTFGLFYSTQAAREAVEAIARATGLRTCPDSEMHGRTRPCLRHQIGRCSAPCAGLVGGAAYALDVRAAREALSGKSGRAARWFEDEMARASAELDFESAARWRDRLRALAALAKPKGIDFGALGDAEAVAIAHVGRRASACLVGCRQGIASGHSLRTVEGSEAGDTDADILAAAVAAIVAGATPPRRIVVRTLPEGVEVIAAALIERVGPAAVITTPRGGDEENLLALAELGAAEALGLDERRGRRWGEDWTAMETLLKTGRLARVEIYDNSHVMGAAAVGAFVVAGPDGFIPRCYRTFRLSAAVAGDDAASMHEVLTRRLSGAAASDLPDLLLIDGGPVQLDIAQRVVAAAGWTERVAVRAVSKGPHRDAGEETLHFPMGEPIQPPKTSPGLHCVQNLRDEAHRFAIATHRNRRSKEALAAAEAIPGLGPVLKRRLTAAFGSPRAAAEAGVEAIAALPGFGRALAHRVVDAFGRGST